VSEPPLVIGVGNEWRSDDAAGLVVARRLAALEPTLRVAAHGGEPVDLIHEWTGEDEVILVDAVDSGAAPGTIHRFDAAEPGLASGPSRGSTHALGVAEAIALGRALGRLPGRLLLFGIEGGRFEAGASLSPEVERAAEELVQELRERLAGDPRRAPGRAGGFRDDVQSASVR
jgi:hydrogenase maturation protease